MFVCYKVFIEIKATGTFNLFKRCLIIISSGEANHLLWGGPVGQKAGGEQGYLGPLQISEKSLPDDHKCIMQYTNSGNGSCAVHAAATHSSERDSNILFLQNEPSKHLADTGRPYPI